VARKNAEVRRRIAAVIVKPVVKRGSNKFDPARFDVELVDGRRIPGPEFVGEPASVHHHRGRGLSRRP
jgi:hypothetical protein